LPEIRRDPIIGRWIIISTERGKRPSDFGHDKDNQGSIPCPFCPGNEEKTPPEIMAYRPRGQKSNESGWWLRVIPNKFPVLQIEGQLNRSAEGLYDRMDGLGAHEVIVETPDHTKSLAQLDDDKIQDVFWAYRDRIVDLQKDPRLQYVLIFKNRGSVAGASLLHSHSQLIATPMVPIRVRQEIVGAQRYFDYKERCIYCDIIRQEQQQNVRVVDENQDFIAISPFASRFPFEISVLPKKHDSHFEDIQKSEVNNLGRLMKSVLNRLERVLDGPPYNFILHNSPLKQPPCEFYHWHIEIMPKLTKTAGFEWGSGFYINPTSPEYATKSLREIENLL